MVAVMGLKEIIKGIYHVVLQNARTAARGRNVFGRIVRQVKMNEAPWEGKGRSSLGGR
jgi:hypothetical protein